MRGAARAGRGRWLAGLGLALGLCAAPGAAQAQLFADGFESGSASSWSHVGGDASYVSSECRSGRFCGAMRLTGGRDQQSIYWAKQVTHSGEMLRVAAWWRFPVGFSWDPGGQPWGYEHKMLIINTANDVGRVLLNLRGGGKSPEIAVHFERLESLGQGVSKHSGVHWPPDGKWHHFEIEMLRRSGTAGRVRVWLDNQLAIDETGRVCGSPCAPIRDIMFGAFSNQGAPKTQSFYLDDAEVVGSFDLSRKPGAPPAPPTTPPTTPPTRPPTPPTPPTPPVAVNCASPSRNWLLCDGFESGGFAGYGDVRSTGVFRFVSKPVVAGRTALESRIAAGTLGENFASVFIADHPLRQGGPGPQARELYLRSRVRYSPGFDMSAGKLFIVNAFESWSSRYPAPNAWAPFYVTLQTINGRVEALLHSKTSGSSVWRPMAQNKGTPVTFQTNRWYDVMLHLKLNSPGRADGVSELFIDGVLKAAYYDVNFRDRYSKVGWNHVMISPLQAAAVNRVRSQYYDEVIISTSPIGATSGAATAAPQLLGFRQRSRRAAHERAPARAARPHGRAPTCAGPPARRERPRERGRSGRLCLCARLQRRLLALALREQRRGATGVAGARAEHARELDGLGAAERALREQRGVGERAQQRPGQPEHAQSGTLLAQAPYQLCARG
jgi:hypothetical protein